MPILSFKTKLANKGVFVRVVQTLAGHFTMQTTKRHIDVIESMFVQAVELA
jgi:site-specific recombinase XerD